jgi:hypothetical protein
MAKQTINIGASPNDGTGTPLRTSFDYCNLNFTELYTAVGPSGNNIVCPGTLTVSAGTLALPSLTTAGDTNTGIYFPAADTIAFVEGGVEAMRINSTGNLVVNNAATITGDLTVDTSTLKVDSTNNRVGIGTASPSHDLHVVGATNARIQAEGTSGFGMVFIQASSGNTAQVQLNSNGGSGRRFAVNSNSSGQFTISDETAAATRFAIDSTGVFTFQNVGGVAGTAMTLNSTGLAVGTASATYKLDLLSTSACQSRIRSTGNGQTVGLRIESKNSDGTDCQLLIGSGVVADNEYNIRDILNTKNLYRISGISASSNAHNWFTGAATASMVLDTTGNLLVGTTNTSATAGPGFKAQYSSTVPQFAIVTNEAGSSTALSLYNVNAAAYRFYVNNAGTVFATNTTISAISDARLKENVQDIDVGLSAILALKPRKFDWKAGKGKDIKGDRGFIAQEFEQVFPQLVDEWKDPAPEGESPYKSVRQDLIPVLVKAIQELTARVQTLEAR